MIELCFSSSSWIFDTDEFVFRFARRVCIITLSHKTMSAFTLYISLQEGGNCGLSRTNHHMVLAGNGNLRLKDVVLPLI